MIMRLRFPLFFVFCSLPALAQFVPNRYTVLLEDPPVAARFTRREEMRTAPALAYEAQIQRTQAAVVREISGRKIQVTGSVSTLINAIFVTATPEQAADLLNIPGVAAVRPMRRFKPAMNKAVQLMNAPAAWNALGGVANAGKGIKIGILDSGIDNTHPAFQDSSLTPPAGFPKCTDGHPEDCAYTNNKIIVARSYVRMLAMTNVTDPSNPAPQSIPDDYTPRDRFGHGTAVAAAAAGNTNTGAVAFNGMAPKAFIGNYKLAGTPGLNDSPTDDVMIKVVQDALADGMDVVNQSWGGSALSGPLDTGAACGIAAGQPCDPVAAAYEAAAKAGLVIAAAAGDTGEDAYFSGGQYPYYGSMTSPASAPSVIAVGATTNSHVFTPAVSVLASGGPRNLAAQASDSVFFPSTYGSNTAPLVDVTKLGNDGQACTALPAASLTGAFALIQRGTCSFATKADSAATAGAAGIVFYMADGSAPISPSGLTNFFGPAVMISNADGLSLRSYLNSNPGAVVSIDSAGIETDLASYVDANGLSPAGSNQLASYSSIGPAPDGSMKPDIVAVGGFDGSISSSFGLYTAAQRLDPNGVIYSASGYAAVDGTSFSAPIVAGAAALVKQAHSNLTGGQVKSALVNTAAQDVTVDDFGTPVDALWLGGGRLDAGAAASSTVTAEPATISFGFLKTGVLPLNRDLTITNRGTASVTLAVAVATKTSAAGTTVAVDKSSITLAAGASTSLRVTLSGTVPKAGQYSGAVTLQGGGASLRLPYLFVVGDGSAFNANPLFGALQGAPGQFGGTIAIQVTDSYGVPVAGSPVAFAVSPRGAVTFQNVTGEPACTPANSTTTATCNTDNYGIAYVNVVMGPQTGTPSVTARAAGVTFGPFTAYILPPPAIDPAHIFNAADFAGTVAPGSFMGFQGTNLVDPDLSSPGGDLATTALLPLTLDAVSVSFDVPSKGISVPASMYYVSANQINVVVPWELQGQTSAQMKVISDEPYGNPFFSNVVTVQLSDYTPAFFESAAVNGIVAAVDLQTSIITATHPAVQGQAISLFANGLGPVNNQPASGAPSPTAEPFARTKTDPIVMIGNKQAQVLYSGLAPGNAAEYQINIIIPTGLTPGSQPITVAIGGKTSKASNLPVQ